MFCILVLSSCLDIQARNKRSTRLYQVVSNFYNVTILTKDVYIKPHINLQKERCDLKMIVFILGIYCIFSKV